jgi:hypothetical protein
MNNLKALFDKAIVNDIYYPVVKTNIFPKSIVPLKKMVGTSIPKYSQELELHEINFKWILDHPDYSESVKIEYLKDALADSTRDALKYINAKAINFWRTSKEAIMLMEEYFTVKQFDKSTNKTERFKYFEFKTKGLFPDTFEIIDDYFKKREALEIQYHSEGSLIYRLLELNKEKEALEYLIVLINDYLQDKFQHITLGARVPSKFDYECDPKTTNEYEGLIFDFLCLSPNTLIAQKATDLLFSLLEQRDYDTYNLYKLTSYLDEARHIELLKHRFEHYLKVDFSPLKLISPEDWKRCIKDLVPEAYNFFGFILENSHYLGKVKGRELWAKFVETQQYWTLCVQPFDTCQICILANCFEDDSLSFEEKKKMLVEANKSNSFFNEGDPDGLYKHQYLRLVHQIYPDLSLSKEDHMILNLDKIISYSNPLNITPQDLRPTPYRLRISGKESISLVEELNEYMKESGLKPVHLTPKLKFDLSIESPMSYIIHFFKESDRCIMFKSLDYYEQIPNYVDFFEEIFQPKLDKIGVFEIYVSQITNKISDGVYEHNVYVHNETDTYHFEELHNINDMKRLKHFVKVINLCLADLKSSYRFVELHSYINSETYLLTEPERIKPLLDKYYINCLAIMYGDEFYSSFKV